MPNQMSQAQKKGRAPQGKPMDNDVRVLHYEFQSLALSGGMSRSRKTRDGFTGPQRRRIVKAYNREKGFPQEPQEVKAS